MDKKWKSIIALFVFLCLWFLQVLYPNSVYKDYKSLIPVAILFFTLITYFIIFQNSQHIYLLFIPVITVLSIIGYYKLAPLLSIRTYYLFHETHYLFPETVLLFSQCMLRNMSIMCNDKKKINKKELKTIYTIILCVNTIAIIFYVLLTIINNLKNGMVESVFLINENKKIFILFIIIDLFLLIRGLRKNLSGSLKYYYRYICKSGNFIRFSEIIFLGLQTVCIINSWNSNAVLAIFWLGYYIFILFYNKLYFKYPFVVIHSKKSEIPPKKFE